MKIHNGEQIVRWLTTDVTQKASSVFRHMQDFSVAVDEDARRREVFDHALMQRRERKTRRSR
ncbi:hypothetical protein [Paraburkholderia sp. D1E]|uniref:hypothetical protein n=1 Tax=Paraburkholderia sp. D1E TaxID=3461398 RepID=UPI0040463FE6